MHARAKHIADLGARRKASRKDFTVFSLILMRTHQKNAQYRPLALKTWNVIEQTDFGD